MLRWLLTALLTALSLIFAPTLNGEAALNSAALNSDSAPVPVTADNIADLRPVNWIAFDALPADARITSGWFTLSLDGAYLATFNAASGGMLIWNTTGELVDRFVVTTPSSSEFPPTILDAQFGVVRGLPTLVGVATADSQQFSAALHPVGGETFEITLPSEVGVPVRVWLDADEPYLWLEAVAPDPDDLYHVVRVAVLNPNDLRILPSGPEHDMESIVRIGRIPAPLAVTATEDGRVRLWDLQTGEISAEVKLDETPVFGRVNETDGRQLAWRDQDSQALHLLDFDTGEDRLVVEIGQEYIQALMLTPSGDLVLAVHIGDDPIVTAWNTATGERYDLGRYRADCTRVPDMVHLSRDGSTLAIGCDTGIEIWQIAPES